MTHVNSNNNLKLNESNFFDLESVRDKQSVDGNFNVFKSLYGGSFLQLPDLNTANFWDYLNNRKHVNFKDFPLAFHKLRLIASKIQNQKLKVLNIACGNGDLEDIVFSQQHKHKLNWTGLDISRRSIESCKKEFPRANFFVGNVKKLKLKAKSFDIVLGLEILEHIQPSKTLKVLFEIYKMLKPGGELILSIPMNENLHRMLARGENPNAHVRAYTENIICAELNIAGFSVSRTISLIAFKKFYWLKYWLSYWFLGFKKPNGLIIFAKKI